MVTKLTDPQEPDTLARIAGRDIYGTIVGSLRRVELWRLGNAWGMQFPVGATKDYMLPFFMKLEADGNNPMRPPGKDLTDTGQLRSRDVKFSADNHVEAVEPPPSVIPAPIASFEAKLKALPLGQLRTMCKMRGITQSRTDSKKIIIARILAASEGNQLEQDLT